MQLKFYQISDFSQKNIKNLVTWQRRILEENYFNPGSVAHENFTRSVAVRSFPPNCLFLT